MLGHFCTGVTVVTALDGAGPAGFTVQSFASVSLDPPLVLVCPRTQGVTWPRIRAVGAFCANILAAGQEALSRRFASSGIDRFEGVGWRRSSRTGSPILTGTLAWVECLIDAEHRAGDHLVVVGRVVELGVEQEAEGPLLFYRGGYGRFEP